MMKNRESKGDRRRRTLKIQKKIILSNLLMILVPLLLLCLMGGIWLNTVGNRY